VTADLRELRAIGIGAAVVGAYALMVLMSGRVPPGQFAQLFGIYFAGAAGLWLVIGACFIILSVVRRALQSRGEPFLRAFLHDSVTQRWARDRGLGLLWPPLLFATLLSSFNAFKQLILPLAGYGFDPLFAWADRELFLGNEGWHLTHALFASPGATIAIDRLYHGWFAPVALGVVICAWLPASTWRLRTQYLFSYIAVWVLLGSVLAFLFGSAGPCFHSRLVGPSPEFDALLARLDGVERITGSNLLALQNQGVLLRAHFGDKLALGGGISAMPSVHNALSVLFAIATWRVNRVVGLFFALYAAAIWIGSIHLGWHYAVDGLVAAVLTCGIWVACGRLAERLEKPLIPARSEPALA
jgi:hypothetical protein